MATEEMEQQEQSAKMAGHILPRVPGCILRLGRENGHPHTEENKVTHQDSIHDSR